MNILRNMDALFIEPSYNRIKDDINNCWKLCQKIKADLGENGYYLDQYLPTVIEVLSNLNLNSATGISDDIYSSILEDCYKICEPDTTKEENEFFDMVKDYIDANSVNFKHKHTQSEFYAGNILIERLSFLYDKVRKLIKNILSGIDYIVSNKMYDKISYLIGEKCMERFNETLCEAFAFGPTMVAAVHQIVMRALEMFCYRDPESSKQLYQFMLEEKSNG